VASKINVDTVLNGVLDEPTEPATKTRAGAPEKSVKFNRKIKAFNELMGNPEKLKTKLFDLTQGLMLLNPELGQLAQQQLADRLNFLYEKLPQDPGTQNGLLGSSWVPDDFAIDTWMRYYEAVADPPSVAELLGADRLSPQAAEALKATSPGTFRQIQTIIIQNPERLSKIEYQRRIQLGYLYDLPTDPMFNVLGALQANLADDQKQGEQEPLTQAPITAPGQSKTQTQLSATQQLTLSNE
jgi:hypothetical protein